MGSRPHRQRKHDLRRPASVRGQGPRLGRFGRRVGRAPVGRSDRRHEAGRLPDHARGRRKGDDLSARLLHLVDGPRAGGRRRGVPSLRRGFRGEPRPRHAGQAHVRPAPPALERQRHPTRGRTGNVCLPRDGRLPVGPRAGPRRARRRRRLADARQPDRVRPRVRLRGAGPRGRDHARRRPSPLLLRDGIDAPRPPVPRRRSLARPDGACGGGGAGPARGNQRGTPRAPGERRHRAGHRHRTCPIPAVRKEARPMTCKGSIFRLVSALTLLGQLVAPFASAYHDSEGAGNLPAAQGARDTIDHLQTIPTLDALRQDLARRAEGQLEALKDAQRKAFPNETPIPSVPAEVFRDGVDPGTRVGGFDDWYVLGDHWKVAPQEGVGGTSAWSERNAHGTYDAMDAILVSPAIDLSAYALQTGLLPFVNNNTVGPSAQAACRVAVRQGMLAVTSAANAPGVTDAVSPNNCPPVAGASIVADQVNLLFNHQYNFVPGIDGGRVLVFTSAPDATTKPPQLPFPMAGHGNHSYWVKP